MNKEMPADELFTRFWDHYTRWFYNHNIAQFAELSSLFKTPIPSPQRIKELGDRHLRTFFDEVWQDPDETTASQPPNQQIQSTSHTRPPQFQIPHKNQSNNNSAPPPRYASQFNSPQQQRGHPYNRQNQRLARKHPSTCRQFQTKQSALTDWSDDETSEKATTANFHYKPNKFNHEKAKNLGFQFSDD